MRIPMKKQILRQEVGVFLLEIRRAGAHGGASTVAYIVNSRSTPKLHYFDNFAAASEWFDKEAMHHNSLHRRTAQARG
jgi:hypothetical protein